jgi:AraC-like DNA-binding protein
LIRLDRNQFALGIDVTASPLGILAIAHLRGGQMAGRSDGSERRYRPGDVFFAVQPEHSYATTSIDADIEVAVIDPALLSQIAGPVPGRTSQPVRFIGYEPVSAQAAQAWKNTCTYVRETVLGDLSASSQPLVVSAAARLLVATALNTFPNSAVTDPTSEDRHDAHDETLRRATAFIDEHAHQDISMADVAEAARVTIRAVQLAFRRHLDITPTEYLRRVRLEHAHHDLVAADPAIISVTAVAYRWGFASSSRFAASYRRAYGVTPSHTLRQDRPPRLACTS